MAYSNNSCRFDVFMTIYLFVFKDFMESNNITNMNYDILNLNTTINALLNDIYSEEKYKFWSFINNTQIDKGKMI